MFVSNANDTIHLDRSKKKTKPTKSRIIQNTLEYVVEYDHRPMDLELISGSRGKGCYVTECFKKGMTPTGVIYGNSKLMAINSIHVEKELFKNILAHLKAAALPMRLKLQSPPFPGGWKPEGGKRRKRRKHRPKAPTYAIERNSMPGSRETKLPQYRSEKTIMVNSRGTRDTNNRSLRRSKSTGSSLILKDFHKRPAYSRFPQLSTVGAKGQLSYDLQIASDEMKEELNYLRTALRRIYSALITTPGPDGEAKQEIQIPFNKKFMKHFQMLEVILRAAQLKRVRERNDPLSKPAVRTPHNVAHDNIARKSDLAGAGSVDQWLGRIIQELGVNHLNLETRAEECVQSLGAICKLKETTDMLSNQVKSMEDLLGYVKGKNLNAMQQVEEFKTKMIDVEQGVGKLVLKIFGLRDRVGSLATCLKKVQQPRVKRLASELGVAPIQNGGARISDLQLINQLDPLTSVLDQIVGLVRKSEIVIRDGLLVEPKKSVDPRVHYIKQEDLLIPEPKTVKVK